MTNTQSTSEADMGYVRDIVGMIANALVQATELPKQIELMQNDLTALHDNLEKTKARNIELDALVGDIRRQRDEAEQSLSQVRAELVAKTSSLDFATSQSEGYKSQLEEARSRLEQAKKERDEYGLKQMEAEDRATQAEAKLAKLAEALGLPKAAPPVVVPSVVPQPIQVEANPAQFGQAQVGSTHTELPQAQPERIYEGEPGFNERSYANEAYDTIRAAYYRTA